ncbi:MAG: hypothetical protein D6803_02105, partial [Anaerolineae bacterium]
LLGTSIPPELAAVLLLFSPLLLLFRRGAPRRLLPIALSVALIARAVEPFLPTRGVMLVSGVGIAALLLALPLLLTRYRPGETLWAIGLAVTASALLRALGAGFDLSTSGGAPWLGALLALATLWLTWKQRPPEQEGEPAGGFAQTLAPALALTSVWVLLYFAFTAPNVIARWTGADPRLVLTLYALGLLLWAVFAFRRPLPRAALLAGNALFAVALVAVLLAYQIPFPAGASAYPLAEPPAPVWAASALWLMLLTWPVLLLDFAVFQQALAELRPRLPALGGAFGLASLYALLLILAHVFTTTYDYIPVVGPFFRDRFWLVHLVPAAAIVLALLGRRATPGITGIPPRAMLGTLVALGIALPLIGLWRAPRPVSPPKNKETLRVVTYNIQQGYREDGQPGHADQLALLRELAPDLIGLQESDTNRLAGGNVDIVGYFASELGMYAYYGPKVVPGTFGIALLSRYPLENPRTFYMFSEGEQTAAIHAQITVNGQRFNLFVTHLGNGGPIAQQENILAEVDGLEHVILMGDFNFRPDGEQYALTTETLRDAWLLRWPEDVDDQGVHLEKRIDHMFVTPDVAVEEVRYVLSPASDHPLMWAAFSAAK